MNERIRQLAEQAQKVIWPAEGNVTELTDLDVEKFAELIVQECYETIKKDMELAHIQLIPIDFGIYANGRLRRIIKEHFGVEE
jgi:prefoldin subunit 5